MKVDRSKLDIAQSRAQMSNKELLKLAQVSEVTFCNIRKGTVKPRRSTIGRIACALGVDPVEIIEQDGGPQ